MEKVNLNEKFGALTDFWSPRIVADYNGNEIRVAKIEGEFLWHHHDDTDELFVVMSGMLHMQFRDKTVTLNPGELIVVPRGVEHCPRTEGECRVLVMDREGAKHTGNVDHERTVYNIERI